MYFRLAMMGIPLHGAVGAHGLELGIHIERNFAAGMHRGGHLQDQPQILIVDGRRRSVDRTRAGGVLPTYPLATIG